MLVEISEIHKMLIKKLQGPEKELECLKEKEYFLKHKVLALRKLLQVLDLSGNCYAKSVFTEIHELELDLQLVESAIKMCNDDILRLLNHYQTIPVETVHETIIIPIGGIRG